MSSAALAVVSMPLSIAVLNRLYGASADIAPWDVARQVFVAQLLPLGLRMALRHHGASIVATIEPGSRRAAAVLLVATRNQAPPAIVATILACLVVSVVTIGRYVAWRRFRGRNPPQAGSP